ncbi:MAG: phosphoribosylamine--glycine ligase [Puniceicoccales bacterium]|jgi:phosphoribosylamine--glycine ligase|nr:phosphoribosylamine--glycine ligase [Puniceicoccales bacterium]
MITTELLHILIIGSGGREHALLQACLRSPLVASVAVAPGNGGMEAEAACYPLDVGDVPAAVALAKRLGTNFVIVGPEVPLALGLADALEGAGLVVYGPCRAGALLEASKTHSKAFLERHNIPTARGEKFTEINAALASLSGRPLPIVIKADGLAAGKGVIIARTYEEAAKAVRAMLDERVFGESGAEILIEDFMEGEEASIMLMVSGQRYVMLPPSQDHKRVGDGDTGPNTGGMGAYAPASVVTPDVRQRVLSEIVEPTLAGLVAEGVDYRGTLYVGIMVTRDGPKVVEFNVRFGDPECQVLLPLLESDVVQLMHDCATGHLVPEGVRIKPGAAVIITLAAAGYPGTIRKNDGITLPDELPRGTQILHSGTRRDVATGRLFTNGGRVLGATALGETLSEAVASAYALAGKIHFDGMHYRRDIAARQLGRDSGAASRNF